MDDRTALEDALKIVRAMRAIHSSRGMWTQGQSARDRHSRFVMPDDPRAVRFCLAGAMWHASDDLHASPAARRLVWELVDVRTDGNPAHWNDNPARRFTDIVACEEGTIADLEAQLVVSE